MPPVFLAATACGSSSQSNNVGAGGGDAAGAGNDATVPPRGIPDGGGADDGSVLGDGGPEAGPFCFDAAPPSWSDPGATAPTADPLLAGQVHHFFQIEVRDQNNAPVVGATLVTTNWISYTSDQNGNVAFYEPGLMDTDVWFSVACAGYTYPKDGLGNTGKALHPTEGASDSIVMTKSGTVSPADAGTSQTALLAGPVPGPSACFAIRAVDSVTSRGVPLVKAVSPAGEELWSDSQGMIAYCNPDFVGQSLTFAITSDGYALAPGAQTTFATVGGGSQTVPLVRRYPGERIYRVTGQGIYRDSVLLGLTTPLQNPNINGLVMGQDTPTTFVYGGQIYWLWQDTNQVAYPLGNFDSSGATSPLLGADGGLSPDLGSNTSYFVNAAGFSRGMVDAGADPMMATVSSPGIWLGGIVTVFDDAGTAQVFGSYYVNTGSAATGWSAVAQLDPAIEAFNYVADYPANATETGPRSTLVKDANGTTYVYGNNPVRFPATARAMTDFANYQVYSAYGPSGSTTLAQNADGSLAYAWTPGATPVTPAALTAAKIDLSQALDGHVTDIATGSGVAVAHYTAMWNGYRKRFSEIIQQEYGTSFLGEDWYTEGDTPLGPWVYAEKVVTHEDGYTFYNPDIIPALSEAGGRIVFFDGTYTAAYTSLPDTPRYNYNEMMYRLDLDDPRLILPVAVYDRGASAGQDLVTKTGVRVSDPAVAASFFAYDRPVAGAVPIAWSGPACGARRLAAGGTPETIPIFYALPAEAADGGEDGGASGATLPLYEYAGPNGSYLYSASSSFAASGYTRGAAIARVWPSPIAVALPVADFLGDLVADAGRDQCVAASGAEGANVTLDGSGSRDLAGPIASYLWTWGTTGCVFASGEQAEVLLPVGTNDVVLHVSDALGNTSSDEVVIAVSGP